MQILVETRLSSSPTVERWGGLFDVSLTEMLGFEQVPCYEGEHSVSNQEFLSFVSKYNIPKYENAVSMIYEQYSGANNSEAESSYVTDEDSFGNSDSEENVSDSEDDSNTSSSKSRKEFSLLRRRSRSNSIESQSSNNGSEMVTVTRWYGIFVPSENALYLESPSSALHSDCLTDILDVAECIQCFKVYIGIPRNRLDVVKRYLFAGFEISKKGQLQKQSPASMHQEVKRAPAQSHILLEYEL